MLFICFIRSRIENIFREIRASFFDAEKLDQFAIDGGIPVGFVAAYLEVEVEAPPVVLGKFGQAGRRARVHLTHRRRRQHDLDVLASTKLYLKFSAHVNLIKKTFVNLNNEMTRFF